MGIERMKRLWLLVPLPSPSGDQRGGRGEVVPHREDENLPRIQRLMQTLADIGMVHLEVLSLPEGAAGGFYRPEVPEPGELQRKLDKLRRILDAFDTHAPLKRGFAANFVTLPLEVTRQEYERALRGLDVDGLHRRVSDLVEQHGSLRRRIEELSGLRAQLEPWRSCGVKAPPELRRCAAWLGTVPARAWGRASSDEGLTRRAAIRRLAQVRGRTLVAVVALREDAEFVAERLQRLDFEPLELPPGAVDLDGYLSSLVVEMGRVAGELRGVEAEIRSLAAENRRAATICLAHWELVAETVRATRQVICSRRVAVVSGYARAVDVPRIRTLLAEREPDLALIARDPAPDEQVPVSLRTSPLVAPARFLTRLFGLPDYFGFDPTPYIFLTFLLFFGFCFGDAIYGMVILVLGLLIARRVREYPNLHDFFRLIAWGGVSSMVVGAVTGAWMADLFSPERGFVSAGSLPARIREFFLVEAIEPLSRPVQALLVALGLGVANQLYGIVLRIYREARRRDYVAAVCDGGLWLLFLPGLVIIVGCSFAGVSGGLLTVGWVLLGVGAAGLVLTQGRRERGFLAKALTGLVSLYGILGTYGTTSFIGDTLSYSRLLALGLTTTIVGMSFNIVAGLLKGVPVAGVVLVGLVLLAGHSFNILISILGAFVHSGRLVFVEFFGRFYEVGGKAFRALGTSERVRIVERR